jgi:flagellar hook-associated protein 2
VAIDAPVTLQGLADRINSTANIPVTASVIRASGTSWQLVLTGKATGAAAQFNIANTLQGPAPAAGGITFADTDGNGVSGDAAADNAVSASDARALINNVTVTSTTNTIADAIPGVTLSLQRKSAAGSPATITVSEDLGATKTRLQKLVETFNDIIKFSEDQQLSASRGESTSIARDPLLRGLRSALSQRLGAEYSAGGAVASLSTIGIEFDRSGRLTFNAATFDEKAADHLDDITKLFSAEGTEENQGVFRRLEEVVKSYTATDGLLKSMQDRLRDQTSVLGRRMADLEERLFQRRPTWR